MNEFKTLFSPIRIGSMELPNRVVMSPMTTDYGTIEQEPSDRLLAYLEARAAGGVGLITAEVCSVALDHRYQMNSLSLSEDRFIEKHQVITEAVHRLGAKIQPQITHPGPESLAPFFEKKPGIGPSISVNPSGKQSCRALEEDEIAGVIEQYAAGALRAKQAGYDGIELHAAHAYMLLGSFLSPLRNARRDGYGGRSLQGRARMLLETMAAIRGSVGDEFPITVSLSGYERFPGGRSANESQRLAQMLVEAGADAFRVSGGTTDGLVTSMVMGSDFPDGINVAQAESIKQVVDVPVIAVGRIHTPELAEHILSEGGADMIAMARPFLADPQWPAKARAGRSRDIRRCISCENCIDTMIRFQNMNCAVNAQTGRELELDLTPVDSPKRVVVIGGGPAGMEAARVANLRGHYVTLFEKQARLGGSLVLASTVHRDNQTFLHWLVEQVNQSTVNLRLGEIANEQQVRALRPDAIIVATGAKVETPPIPGANQPHVFSGAQLRRWVEGTATSNDFLAFPSVLRGPAAWAAKIASPHLTPGLLRSLSKLWLPIGKRVVVVGSDLAAIELAEFLGNRGRKVHVLDENKLMAQEIGPKRLTEHTDRLDRMGVTFNTEITFEAIEAKGLRYKNADGVSRFLPADSIVLAGEPVAEDSVLLAMEGLAADVQAIGDCTGLGLIQKATEQGMRAACGL
ncbi:MAG: FAD-dependent oxidoreductase [Halioglobus sp.]